MSRIVPLPPPISAEQSEAAQQRSPAKFLFGLALLSRILIFEVGALAYRYLPHAWVQNVPGYFVPSGSYWYQSLLGVWANWDGYWYLSIARIGYEGRAQATAFFPLYPLLVRLFGGVAISGIVVSLLCFSAALWLLFLLARLEFGEQTAWYAVLALMFFPSSFYLNAVYPESLVLLLSVGSLFLLVQKRYLWAAVVAGIASAASVDGLLLGIPLVISLWHDRRPWREWAVVALVPVGLLAYMGYLWQAFGSPLTFQAAQSLWSRAFAPPWITVWRALVDFVRHLGALSWPTLFAVGEPLMTASNVWNLLFAALGIALLVLTIRSLRPAIWAYAAIVLLVPLLYPAAGAPLMSAPRFLLSAWPIFIAAGALLARRPSLFRPWLAAAVLLGVLFVSLFATAHWVA